MAVEVADLFATLGLKVDKGAWAQGEKLIEGLKTGLEYFAIFEIGKKIVESVHSVIELGGALNDTAQKTGVSVEALQEYGYIAKQNSSSTDAFAHAVVKLARGLDEATQKGSGPAADALQRIGLSLSDPKFKNSTLDDKIAVIAEHLQKFPDGATKTALAMDLFGKSGADLIPTLNDIAENGAALRKEFRDMGGELSGEDTKALDELGDQIDKLKANFGAILNQIGVALVPTLLDAVMAIREWIKENKALISSGIEKTIKVIIAAFRVLAFVIKLVVDIIQGLDDLGVFDAIQAGIAAIEIVAIGLADVLGDIFDSLSAVFDAAISQTKEAIGVFKKAFDYVKQIIAPVVQWVVDQFKHGYDNIKRVWDSISGVFTGLADGIKSAFEAVINWISDKIDWAWEQAKRVAQIVAHPIQAVEDYFGGDDARTGGTAAPTRREGGAAQPTTQSAPVTVNGGDTTVIIHAASADAREVANLVDQKIAEHHDKVMSNADAASGGKDIDQ